MNHRKRSLSQIPLEFQLLGYSPEVFPGLTSYAPPLIDQPLLEGAAEEEPSLTPCGVIAAAEACPPMPDSCKQMPFVVMEVGNRYSEDKVGIVALWPCVVKVDLREVAGTPEARASPKCKDWSACRLHRTFLTQTFQAPPSNVCAPQIWGTPVRLLA